MDPSYIPLALLDHVGALEAGESDQQYTASLVYPACVVDVDSPQDVTLVAAEIEAERFTTSYVEQQVNGLTGHLDGVLGMVAGLAIMITVLSILWVGSMVAASVRARRSELGVMLAIGFSQRAVAAVVAGEAIVTGLAGAVLGVTVAVGGVVTFAAAEPSAGARVPWLALPVVLVGAVILCTVAAIGPARRAMRLDCVSAIRAE
jgi:ABC-type antimicrobial peptide transport system permease subunit